MMTEPLLTIHHSLAFPIPVLYHAGMKKICAILSALCAFANPAFADFSTPAKSAFLVDPVSGAVIVDKASDILMPPSSMLKMMTLAVVFDAVKDGGLKMDEMLPVSENADYKNRAFGAASKICLEKGQRISVRDAILGVMVMSGGDASVVLAERLAGSEDAFTGKMLKKARAIGMLESSFGNATGLTHPDNLMTSRELAMLAQYLIDGHPDLYPMFATRTFEFGGYQNEWCRAWGKLKTSNYNKLLFIMPGADGLKTGHTDAGGFGMTASATRGGRRLIGVLNGMKAKDHNTLAREMKRLLDHGFDTTSTRAFYQPGDVLARVPVWYGRKATIDATIRKPFAVTLEKGQNISGLRLLARYQEPAVAPIKAGDELGEVIAELNGRVIARAPLVAKEKVGKVIFVGRIIKNIKIIFGGS